MSLLLSVCLYMYINVYTFDSSKRRNFRSVFLEWIFSHKFSLEFLNNTVFNLQVSVDLVSIYTLHDNSPAGHGWHCKSVSERYVPRWHTSHAVRPTLATQPAGQGVHAEDPWDIATLASLQGRQSAGSKLPDIWLAVPTEQGSCPAVPPVQLQ